MLIVLVPKTLALPVVARASAWVLLRSKLSVMLLIESDVPGKLNC